MRDEVIPKSNGKQWKRQSASENEAEKGAVEETEMGERVAFNSIS